MDVGDAVVNKYKLELLCEDGEVDELVDALVAAARTGQSVAGWVTVSDVARAVSIG
jgi:nitrogen regulatory protein P-II 1